jgi:hypothetical protein
MQIHHIRPKKDGGTGDFLNGIPVCLDCHAEIESTSNMGRTFTEPELRKLRDDWFRTVAERPEVIIRAAQTQTETGPLQSVLAELDFNRFAVRGDKTLGCAPLVVKQFERAIATNALSALDEEAREAIFSLYACIYRLNHTLDELMRVQRIKEDRLVGPPVIPALDQRNALRSIIEGAIPGAMILLARALGQRD